MPRRKKPVPTDVPDGDTTKVPCRICALSIDGPPPRAKDSPRTPTWPEGETCAAILATGGAGALVADLLGRAFADTQRAHAREFSRSDEMPVAYLLDQFARMPHPKEAETASYRGSPGPMPISGAGLPVRWGWLTPEDVAVVAVAFDRHVRDATALRRHESGPCGLCGVQRSVRWWPYLGQLDSPRAKDRWPLCEACGRVFERCGESVHGTGWLAWVTARCFGLDHASMGLELIEPYANTVPRRVGVTGCRQPFGFIPPERLALARRRLWAWRPDLAPQAWRDRQARIAAASALVAKPPPRRDGVLLFDADRSGIDF
jgi:hypothetical protein